MHRLEEQADSIDLWGTTKRNSCKLALLFRQKKKKQKDKMNMLMRPSGKQGFSLYSGQPEEKKPAPSAEVTPGEEPSKKQKDVIETPIVVEEPRGKE